MTVSLVVLDEYSLSLGVPNPCSVRVPLDWGFCLTVISVVHVDSIKSPADFFDAFANVTVNVAYNISLLRGPTVSSAGTPHHLARFATPGFCFPDCNLPEICTASGYAMNPTITYKIFSARLSWICNAWFGNYSGFMQMLYQSGALISGSAALKVVSGKLFQPSDVDFVVTAARAHVVFAFLISKGYRHNIRSVPYSEYYVSASLIVCRFTMGDRSVDVTIAPVIIYCLYFLRIYLHLLIPSGVGAFDRL